MQCLFCGKELALLKRLRGGGEFCSEAHRKEYQDQYEQLALARLMQAKPPAEPLSPGVPLARPSGGPANSADARPQGPYAGAPVATIETPAPLTAQASARHSASERAPKTNDQPAGESVAPLAGFVTDPVVPAVTTFQQAGLGQLEHTWERVTAGPSIAAVAALADAEVAAPSGSSEGLPPASRVELALSLQALDHHTRASDRGMELREFTGPAPVMQLQLHPENGSEPAGADDVMEILMSPHPPQKAKPWLGAPRVFPAAPAELGDLARLDFATTGFAYSDSPAPVQQAVVPQAAAVLPPEPPPAELEPEAMAEPVAAEPPAPALVTTALPVTLHGLAAGRAKLSQAFPGAISAASDVQIPPSATLPLRPVIVFGPAPAPASAPETAAPQTKPEPAQLKPAPLKQVQPERVQPKPAQQTPAETKPAVRPQASVVPAPQPVPIKRPAAAEAPAAEPRVTPHVEPRRESPAPRAQEAAHAIPSLHLEATESAWGKLSTGVKIGVAAAVIVGLSGIAYLVTRGNGKPAPETPVGVTTAPAVAAGVAISGGWIDDWANSARSKRHISVLSGSAKLSDYRLEFQAQIQSKAIGWIFRGLNPRNYYVTKLEVVTPGLQPTIALVRFAVVDGQDENRVVVPLPLKVRIDTTYRIRFDAIGNHFTTWVQDQKIDEWTDSRFGSGGVGFFSEGDEQAAMQGPVNVVPLVPKN